MIISHTDRIVYDSADDVVIDGHGDTWEYDGAAGPFLSLRSCKRVTIRDLTITYTNPAFTGDLVSTGWGTRQCDTMFLRTEGVRLAGDGVSSARSLLCLDRAICSSVRDTQFQSARHGILGALAYSNAITVDSCVFMSLIHSGIYNAGEGWRIVGSTFEPLVDGRAGAYAQDLSRFARGLSFHGNWFGDVTTPGGRWISTRVLGLSVQGNFFGSPGGPDDAVLEILCSQGVHLAGNDDAGGCVYLRVLWGPGYSYGVTVESNNLVAGRIVGSEYLLRSRAECNYNQPEFAR